MATGKKIFLIRHGQTEFNLNGIVQGSGVDAPLNETGREQADRFYRHYQSVGISKVYPSSLIRTHQSVKRFLDAGLPWQIMPELNEISWGKHEGKRITPEEDAYYHWLLKQWQEGRTDLHIEGGESPNEVSARLSVALAAIMSDPADRILVCMHGRAMRVMLCLMLNYPLKSMDLFEHRNLCLYELHHTGEVFHAVSSNNTAHLEQVRVISA
ncbi:MAG: histidine phosphatase family protein [Bacteroidota bacterium]